MKILSLTALFLTSATLYALPIGNPSEPALLRQGVIFRGSCENPARPFQGLWCSSSMRLGFYGDYVFNRHTEAITDVPSSDSNFFDVKLEQTQLFTNAALIEFNFWNRIDLFGTVGNSKIVLNVQGPLHERLNVETSSDLSWSLGGRATLLECNSSFFGTEVQYFYTNPHVNRETLGTGSTYPNKESIKYREWQIGFAASHLFSIFLPYIGIKWSHAMGSFPVFVEMESSHDFGYAVGASILASERAIFTVEGRFVDEKAIHVNGQFRF
jgi:major outer membrane protein